MKNIKLFLLLILVVTTCGFTNSGFTVAGFDSTASTNYRKKLTLTGSTDGALTDYQIMLTVHYGSGTDSGSTVYCEDRCRFDFADIRFTKSDGVSKLNHYRSYLVKNSVAHFWVEVDSLPASPTTTDIYMYYNNSGALSESDCDDAFVGCIDYEDSDTFNADNDNISVQQPRRLGDIVTIAGGAAHEFANPTGIKLLNGDYLASFSDFNTTTFNNNSVVSTAKSTDGGKTWSALQITYDDPTPFLAHNLGIFEKESGSVYSLAGLLDAADVQNGQMDREGIMAGISTDNGDTWPAEASWTQIFGTTDDIIGIPSNWEKLGANWYACGETFVDPGTRDGKMFKFDGTNFTIVSTLTGTPDQISECAVASLGGNNMIAVARESAGTGDTGVKTVKMTSSDLGATWGAQSDISNEVGIIQDPDLTWVQGTPGDGVLMLHGRQGPNKTAVNHEDNVVWFSYDNGSTWKEKTVIFRQFDDGNTSGGYTSAIVDDNWVYMLGWSDQNNEDVADILGRKLFFDKLETLELHSTSNTTDNEADVAISDGGLANYIIEAKVKSFDNPNTDNVSIKLGQSAGNTNRVAQFWVPHSGGNVRSCDGAASTSEEIYASFAFETTYVMEITVDESDTGSELEYRLYDENKATLLGSNTNETYCAGSPTQTDTLEIGPGASTHRALAHIDWVFIRKTTTNEPTFTSWAAEESGVTYPN